MAQRERLELDSQALEIPINPNSQISRSRDLIEDGDLDEAIAVLTRALESDLSQIQRPKAHNNLCVALQMKERFAEALHHCNAALALRPYNWRYLNNRGNTFLHLGSPGLAIRDYRAALKIAPQANPPQFNIELAQQQFEEDAI